MSGPRRGEIGWYVRRYIHSIKDIEGKLFFDIPAGAGNTSALIRERGGVVEAYDLFPESFAAEGITCKRADLGERLPVDDGRGDYVICQEGIEHLPNQVAAFREFNRILNKGGSLVITAPSFSHLRARFSYLLHEGSRINRLPPNETNAIWLSGENRGIYFGHLFVPSIQHLRVLGKIAGLDIVRVHRTNLSATSVLLGWLYPMLVLANLHAYRREMRRKRDLDKPWKRGIYREILKLNLSPKVLFCKHLFVEFRKTRELDEVAEDFHEKLAATTAGT